VTLCRLSGVVSALKRTRRVSVVEKRVVVADHLVSCQVSLQIFFWRADIDAGASAPCQDALACRDGGGYIEGARANMLHGKGWIVWYTVTVI
jgi:hypothetical protein